MANLLKCIFKMTLYIVNIYVVDPNLKVFLCASCNTSLCVAEVCTSVTVLICWRAGVCPEEETSSSEITQ